MRFNTTLVNVHLYQVLWIYPQLRGFNTTLVNVHLVVLYSKESFRHCFNTTLVNVHPKDNIFLPTLWTVSIQHLLMFIVEIFWQLEWKNRVSIQHLLMFIWLPSIPFLASSSVSIQHLLMFIGDGAMYASFPKCFNTTLVNVHQKCCKW